MTDKLGVTIVERAPDQGRQKPRVQYTVETARQVLLEMLEYRFKELPEQLRQTIESCEHVDTLGLATIQVKDFQSIEEVVSRFQRFNGFREWGDKRVGMTIAERAYLEGFLEGYQERLTRVVRATTLNLPEELRQAIEICADCNKLETAELEILRVLHNFVDTSTILEARQPE